MTTIQITQALNLNKNSLLRYALQLTKSHADAHDLYQETAYRAIKYKARCENGTNTKGWLMTIMRNLFINAYRKKRRRQTLQDGSPNTFLLDAGNDSVMNDGEMNSEYQDLMKIIESLEEYLRIPFLLSFQGYKYEEIGDQLQIPLGTVKSRIFMARKQIQKAIQIRYATQTELHFAA